MRATEMTTYKKIIEKIQKAKNIAILSHVNPDPDACGSMLGARDFCRSLGKSAEAFCGVYSNYMSKIFDMGEFKTDFKASNFDLVILTDLHTISRLDCSFVDECKKCKNIVILDHHIVMEDEVLPTKYAVIETKASASQVVLNLYRNLDAKPSEQTATYLYAGIMGDTSRFLHSNLSTEVFEDAIMLLESGAHVQEVYDRMFRSTTKKELKMSEYVYSHLKFLNNGRVAYIVFTDKEYKKLGVVAEDVKYFSNSLITIEGVEASFLVYQLEKNKFKVSCRCEPKFDVAPLARRFLGGGHSCAAAFSVETKPSKVTKLVKAWAAEVLNG
jgi:phosphoesterase RecJ-like protein